MKKILVAAFLIVSVILFNFCMQEKQATDEVKDIIKTVNLTAGVSDTLLISDMFYSDNYNLTFSKNSVIRIKYLEQKKLLILDADKNYSGITTIDFSTGKHKYAFPVRVKKIATHTFTYKPDKEYKNIYLFGEFNNWNRQNLKFTDEDSNGVYEVKVPIQPGIYQYKIFADSNEIVDPTNPKQVPNGMGGINSVIKIANLDTTKEFLHIGKENYKKGKVSVSFYYETTNSSKTLNLNNIIILLNNFKVENNHIHINNSKITVELKSENLIGRNLLRAAVSADGKYSNIQNIVFVDGKSVSNKDKFSWNDGIIYSLMIDRFNNGDKTNDKPIVQDSLFKKANYMGGDFQGVLNKLNDGYFDSLGVNIIWISPVYDNPDSAYRESPEPHRWFTGYHGYWPISPTRVEEHFGTMKKLKKLVSIAHKHNIKILLDFVSHHVFKTHPYVSEHPDWFGELRLPDGTLNLRRWDDHRLTTWFEPYLPSFNFIKSKTARDSISENAIWWLKTTGADGFRHDAVKHVPNIFWRELTLKLRRRIEIPQNVKVYQIGETFGDYNLVSSYVNNGQLNSQFNFNLYNIAQAAFIEKNYSFENLNNEIEKSLNIYGSLNLMGNIMDSHDKNRFMAYADGDLDLSQWSAIEEGWNNPPKVDHPSSYKKAKLYLAYMNSIPGVPVIYYGSEFGMTGDSDPDNRRMMRFGNQLNKYEKSMLADVSKIIHLRKKHTALRYGDYYNLIADKNFFVYLRSDLNERILVVLNKNKRTKNIIISLPGYYKGNRIKDLISNDKITVYNHKVKIRVLGIGYRFFKLL